MCFPFFHKWKLTKEKIMRWKAYSWLWEQHSEQTFVCQIWTCEKCGKEKGIAISPDNSKQRVAPQFIRIGPGYENACPK